MKKILSIFALLALTCSIYAAEVTVTKTMAEAATDNKWESSKNYKSFNVDDAISVTANNSDGGGKYYDNLWRLWQAREDGKFTIQGAAGVTIQTIKIKYEDYKSSGGIISRSKGTGQPAENVIKSDSVLEVGANSMVYYVGSTGTGNGTINVRSITVTYSTTATEITLEESMTISVGNTFQIGFPVPADSYCAWSSNNEAAVSVNKNGIITANATGIATITAKSASLVETCEVTVEEATGTSLQETFSAQTASNSWYKNRTEVKGDNNILQWIMRGFKRATGDQVEGVLWTRMSYNEGNNYIALNNNSVDGSTPMEGGVKRVSFQWKAATKDLPVVFDVDNTENPSPMIAYKTNLPKGSAWTSAQTFTRDVNMAKNTQFRIQITDASAATLIISPLTITPYLLFNVPNHKDTITIIPSAASYNLGAVLINNTGAPANYTIESNTTGSACAIDEDGVMDLSDVKQSGDIQIKAKWNEDKVYTTMTLHVNSTQVTLANANVALNESYTPAPVVKLGETTIENANITYASSNTNVAKVSDDGKTIMLFGTGTTTITTTVAKGDTYLGATTTSALTVNTFTPEQGTYWEETFANMDLSDYENNEKSFDADSLIYPKWKIRQYKLEQADKTIKEFRLNQKNVPYLKSSEAMEGGIKYVLFYWHLAGNQNPGKTISFSVSALDGESVISTYTSTKSGLTDGGIDYPCAVYLDAKQNASYRLNIETSVTDNVSWYSAVKFVPYLLFTAKNHEATINISPSVTSYKLKDVLINNTDEDPTYTILYNSTGSACTITDGVIDLSDVISGGDIKVKASWNDVYTTMVLHVAYNPTPAEGTYFEETFAAMTTSDKYGNQSVAGDSSVYGTWNFVDAKRNSTDATKKEFRLNSNNAAAVSSQSELEGGIKDVYFYWHIASNSPDQVNVAFKMTATYGDNQKVERTVAMTNIPVTATENHPSVVNFNLEKNAKFKLETSTPTNWVSLYSPLKFVPYLLYTKKNLTINAKDYPDKKYTNTSYINNTGVEIAAGQEAIVFSIKDETDATKKIATVNEETGEVTLVGPGTVTVQATWSEVSTSYSLTITSTTLVTLLYDDGTEGKDEFTMNSGDVFPTDLAYPTREDYTFNAYFTQKDSKGRRLTVTGDNKITQWTKNTSMTDDNRKWISLNQKDTLYAHWKAVRTIALDNQSATTAGTEQVKIAYCPNNEDIYLTSIDELPAKTGYIFGGYYTETKGKGSQIIDATGAFIANVSGYTNNKTMWQKDDDITLYAKWTAKTTTVTMMRNDGSGLSDELTATYGQAFPTKTFTLPTRTGYEFNAYYTSLDCKAEERMTVTSGKDGRTLWLENRTVGDVTYTNGRNWIFLGETLTLYAKWAEQRTITLDNQEATTAGTVSVITANTPNNGLPWLDKKDITCPVKEGFTFLGYFTEKNGKGKQLIGTDGKFIASVPGYTNSDKCWIKDADVTLYAAWKEEVVEITLNEGDNNATALAENDGKLANVELGRTITAGMYNTFCLPFNVDADMMADKFGGDYNLQEFTSATLSGDKQTVTINFTRVKEMEAGKPYLIKTSANVANPSFEEVRMVNTTGTTSGEGIVMKAIINPTHITPGDHSHMIVIANDNMAWLQTGDESTMNGMRAYFEVENNEMKAALRNASPRLVTNETNTPTGLNANANANVNCKVMIDGQLIIIRDGVKYNAHGQTL